MAESLKEQIFSEEAITKLAASIKNHFKKFEKSKFIKSVMDETWKDLKLKERMRKITIELNNFIHLDYRETVKLYNKVSDEYKGFPAIVFPDFVEVFGLDDFDTSTEALKKYTIDCSSEFAVRPFIIKYEDKMMDKMTEWSKDENFHVRRLATEGCRPRLPWAIALPKFKKDPSKIIPILEELKNDESEYVRKSVANNLNDISKDNPEITIALCKKWYGQSEKLNRLVKHSLRTLLKKGNKEALEIVGIKKEIDVKVINFRIDKTEYRLDEKLNLEFDIMNNEKKSISARLEYKLYFMKSNGKQSAKLFKISEIELESKKTESVSRSFLFVTRTTRKLYSGEHKISICVNGVEKEELSFNLKL